jgi:hypothetical protein
VSGRRRWPLIAAGIGLVVVGGVWILQGAGILGGSFMTGSSRWLEIGSVCVVIGVVALVAGLRRS